MSPRSTENSKETLKFPPEVHANHEILHCTLEEALYAAAFPKKDHVPSWNSEGYLTRFRKLQKFPQIPVPTREKH